MIHKLEGVSRIFTIHRIRAAQNAQTTQRYILKITYRGCAKIKLCGYLLFSIELSHLG